MIAYCCPVHGQMPNGASSCSICDVRPKDPLIERIAALEKQIHELKDELFTAKRIIEKLRKIEHVPAD